MGADPATGTRAGMALLTRVLWAVALMATATAGLRACRGPSARNYSVLIPLISRMDANRDGRVQADEAAALSRPGEPSWDLDNNGELEPAELEAMLRVVQPRAAQRAHLAGDHGLSPR